MDKEKPKISFGFSGIKKKVNIIPQTINKSQISKVQLISSISEGNSIEILGKNEDDSNKKLVIVMSIDQRETPIARLIKNKRSIKIEPNVDANVIKIENQENDQQISDDVSKLTVSNGNLLVNIKTESPEESLDQRAAREIIEELSKKDETNETKIFALPVNADDLPLEGAKESTLGDYENIPINDFGKAMLRGMGWDEAKEKKAAENIEAPFVRPKGMGLGADKVIKKQALLIQPTQSEKLEVKRNACVKILAGKHMNLYGTIEGFDEGGGRVIVKLAIGGLKMTLNEFMVQPISKEEFAQYSKVLNTKKYEEYKNNNGKPIDVKDVKVEKARSRSLSPEKKETWKNETKPDRYRRSRSKEERKSRDHSKNHKVDERRSRKHSKKDKYRDSSDSEQERRSRKYRSRSRSREKLRSKRNDSASSSDYKKHNDSDKKHKKKSKKSKKHRSRS
ncbi:unnamed protein product [Diamesa hyperborea]